jgi:hypothetical protein
MSRLITIGPDIQASADALAYDTTTSNQSASVASAACGNCLACTHIERPATAMSGGPSVLRIARSVIFVAANGLQFTRADRDAMK